MDKELKTLLDISSLKDNINDSINEITEIKVNAANDKYKRQLYALTNENNNLKRALMDLCRSCYALKAGKINIDYLINIIKTNILKPEAATQLEFEYLTSEALQKAYILNVIKTAEANKDLEKDVLEDDTFNPNGIVDDTEQLKIVSSNNNNMVEGLTIEQIEEKIEEGKLNDIPLQADLTKFILKSEYGFTDEGIENLIQSQKQAQEEFEKNNKE